MSSRRLRLSVALALTGSLVALPGTAPAGAVGAAPAPVKAGYTCESPDLNGNKLDITFTVSTTPAAVYVGRSATPKMVVKAIIPGNIVALAALFGVKSASATGTFSVKSGSTSSARPFVFPRTDIPQTNQDFPVTINIGLPSVAATAVGSKVYKPGPVAITLTGYKNATAQAQPEDSVGSVPASCTAKTPTQTLAKISYLKSPTTVTAPAAYAKAAHTITSVVTVAASSGVTPYGKVTSVLYRGSTKLKTVTRTLASGKTTAVFAGVKKKGVYKVVSKYSGSGAHRAASTTRSLTVR